MDPDGLLVAFGLANVLAAIPITPGGLGYVDAAYITVLVGFGARSEAAALGVASYRLAQFFFPIIIGAFFYATLRIGPWSIERRDRLARLRDLAHDSGTAGETRTDWLMRVWRGRVMRPMPDIDLTPSEQDEQERVDAITRIKDRDTP